jgi:hypothetical protein
MGVGRCEVSLGAPGAVEAEIRSGHESDVTHTATLVVHGGLGGPSGTLTVHRGQSGLGGIVAIRRLHFRSGARVMRVVRNKEDGCKQGDAMLVRGRSGPTRTSGAVRYEGEKVWSKAKQKGE